MGKSTISMAIFHGKMLVHQRVLIPQQIAIFTTGFRADFRTHPATMMDDPPRDDPPSSAAQN